MDSAQLNVLFGWAAFLSALATLVTGATAVLFLSRGGRFGKINDAASVAQMLFMVPVAAALFFVTRRGAAGLALLALAIGVIGMLVAAALQALLVFGAVKFEQTFEAVLAAGGTVGLWLLLTNCLILAARALPGGLTVLGIVAGTGYILAVIGFHAGGQQHPLFYTGSFLGLLAYSIWAIWLARLLLLQALTASA